MMLYSDLTETTISLIITKLSLSESSVTVKERLIDTFRFGIVTSRLHLF